MKKFKILGIALIAIIGALLIYKKFDDTNIVKKNNVLYKFSSEYNLLPEVNVFSYKNIDNVIDLMTSGTGIVFFCTPEYSWCQYYALFLNDVAIENKIDEIYYFDIKDERTLNSNNYKKVLSLLDDYLLSTDTEGKKIFMPNTIFIKNGVVIGNNNQTAVMNGNIDPFDYWTEKRINNLKEELKKNINKLN